jgi:tetrahydromethanopterin S-methyltransferase subunit A/thymidylate synthase
MLSNSQIKKFLESKQDFTTLFSSRQKLISEHGITFELASPVKNPPLFKKFPNQKINYPIHGDFITGNKLSPVGVTATLQVQPQWPKFLEAGAGIAGSCLTLIGVENFFIWNVVSNPNLRFIVLTGKSDSHFKAGDMIYKLYKFGVDKDKQVIKAVGIDPHLRNVPDDVIERFRKQVTIINIIGASEEEVQLVIRACLQEPEKPCRITTSSDSYLVYDPGSEGKKPIFKEEVSAKPILNDQGFHRVGLTLHAQTVADSYEVLRSHITKLGNYGQSEEGPTLDIIAPQIIIHRPNRKIMPSGWNMIKDNPHDFFKKYAFWGYLTPQTTAKFDHQKGYYVPKPQGDDHYVYGTRLTSWGDIDQTPIEKVMAPFRKKFTDKLPLNEDVLKLYKRLEKVKGSGFNQIFHIAQNVKTAVEKKFGNSYNNYLSLQIPSVDIIHSLPNYCPCFAMMLVYPRRILGKWQLDVVFQMRANDFTAYPANAAGGMKIQEWLSWYAQIKPGLYVHSPGCLHFHSHDMPDEATMRQFHRYGCLANCEKCKRKCKA